MKTYHGERTKRGCKVTVDGQPLRMKSDLSGNATTAFDWGFVGGGQLSLALLSDFLGDDAKAKALCEEFERRVVAELPHSSWTLSEPDFAAALRPLVDVSGAGVSGDDGDAGAAFGDMPVRTTDFTGQENQRKPVGGRSKDQTIVATVGAAETEEDAEIAAEAERAANALATGTADQGEGHRLTKS